MPRRPAPLLSALLAGLLTLAGWDAPARAEDAPAAEPAGLAWAASWDAAREAARAGDRLRFVYYGRKRPPCPPCRALEAAVFARPESRVLGTRYLAVRLLAGDDATDATRAVAHRYRLTAAPTMLALAPDGGVLARAFPRDLDGILATMAQAELAEAAFRRRAATLGGSDDPADIRALARLHAERASWAQARQGYERLLAMHDGVRDAQSLLAVLEAQDDRPARRALLERLVAAHPEHPHHTHWRIALVLLDAPDAAARRDALRALLAEVSSDAARATVRFALGDVHATLRENDQAMTQWDWILAHAPESPQAADALLRKATTTLRRGQGLGDPAVVRAARDLLTRFLREHPEHDAASTVRRLRAEAERILGQLEAKQARADEPAKR